MNATRRAFLQQTGALGTGLASSWLANLAAMSEAAAQTAPTDYKALVCVFLQGGNDHANTVVPLDAPSYATYQAMRPDLYYHRSALLMGDQAAPLPAGLRTLEALSLPPVRDRLGRSDRQFALAPPLSALYKYVVGEGPQALGRGQLAVLMNVGPLIEPTVGRVGPGGEVMLRKQAQPGVEAMLPTRLESHNDQVSVWQSSDPEGATLGWAGMAASALSQQPRSAPFSCISAAGKALLLTGTGTVPYAVSSKGATASVPLAPLRSALYGSAVCSQVLGQVVLGQGSVSSRSHILEQDLVATTQRAIAADDVLRAIPFPEQDPDLLALNTLGQGVNSLARQLRTVAHLIRHRGVTGLKRQVFYVALGGFDNHSGLATDHPRLLRQLGDAMAAFQGAMASLGMADAVTTFTASDFGRTLNSNGDGSDHGWGSMHFVLGGVVRGGQCYGLAPVFRDDTLELPEGTQVDDLGRGRLIPTMGVEQLAYTLSRWMGVPDAAMGTGTFLPDLPNFSTRDLGFMKNT